MPQTASERLKVPEGAFRVRPLGLAVDDSAPAFWTHDAAIAHSVRALLGTSVGGHGADLWLT
eukprot:11245413-Alexandrium_andersonii.AAC.1